MPRNYTIDGKWFHPRQTCKFEEFNKIIELVSKSRLDRFKNLSYTEGGWGNDENPLTAELAQTIGVEPSTLRTKIKQFQRIGFLRETNACPLKWTSLGELWNELVNKDAPQKTIEDLYRLIVASCLSIYSFDEGGYQSDPSQGHHPLQYLLRNTTSSRKIDLEKLKEMIDAHTDGAGNYSYWKRDFELSGIFAENESGDALTQTDLFPKLVEALQQKEWTDSYTTEEIKLIRENPLHPKHPFSEAIGEELEAILQNTEKEDQKYADALLENENVKDVLEEKESHDLEAQPSIPDSFSRTKRRAKQGAWSKVIKDQCENRCCLSTCDIADPMFLEAAHIKPYGLQDEDPPHRAHPLNGLCLCKHCHTVFEKGLFSLNDEASIILSPKLDEIESESMKEKIRGAEGDTIQYRDARKPLQVFMQYHREHIFKP